MREQILSSATLLFIEHGYFGSSMRQIAESVGVTKAALYYHFKDKEDLFLAILETYLEKVEALIVEIQNENSTCSEKITLLANRILDQPVDQRAIIRLASQEMSHLNAESKKSFGDLYHTRFIQRIERMLEAGIQNKKFRAMDPKVAAWSLLGLMYPYFYPVHSNDISLTTDAIDQLISIFLSGVSSKKGSNL
jgi:AcrR family transcriptional regulator